MPNPTIIYDRFKALAQALPQEVRGHLLLTGGSAALLYGSERPFSNDLDFMVAEKFRSVIEKSLHLSFAVNANKPIFHSLAGHLTIADLTYDLILKSTVQLPGSTDQFSFWLTDEIEARKIRFQQDGQIIDCIPKELLIVIKLLAGRGKELNKYDLVDVQNIIKKAEAIDALFMKKIVRTFCQPLKLSLPVLLKNARQINSTKLISVLEPLLQ